MQRITSLIPKSNLNDVDSRLLMEHLRRIGYSLRRYYVDEFHLRHVQEIRKGSLILDLGGKRKNKRGAFTIENYSFQVVNGNISTIESPDIQLNAVWLPFRSESFSALICSELLEHVSDPIQVLKETYRVLQGNGILMATAPFLYHLHADPYDYGRYTDWFWFENLKKIGFTNIHIEKQGFFWSVVVDLFREYIYMLRSEGWLPFLPTNWFLSKCTYWCKRWAIKRDSQHLNTNNNIKSKFTTGHGFMAYKP